MNLAGTIPILMPVLVALSGVLGVVFTALTLPGAWFVLLVAGGVQWWRYEFDGTWMFSFWTLGACVALAVLAEVVELIASALGAKRFGASRRGALASILGAVLGAIVGTVLLPVPIVGTIVGAALGAGVATLLVERATLGRTWRESTAAGAGAAAGRLVATLAKVGFTIAIALTLSIASLIG